MRWYINRTGNAEGPFDEPTLLGMIGRREVVHAHQICSEGAQAWVALSSHPPFAQALAVPPPQAPVAAAAADPYAAAYPVAADVHHAAHAVAADVHAAANSFGAALAAPGGQQPVLAAPGLAAPGEGFFEQAQAQGTPPSDDAKAGAGMAHLLAAAGAAVSCGCLGGVAGAFVGSILYKEQPKSPFALYHINQALVFQGVVFAVNVALSIVFVVLRIVGAMIFDILGLVFLSFHLVNLALWGAAIVVPLLHSGKAKRGEWSEYPMVGKKVLGLKNPILK